MSAYVQRIKTKNSCIYRSSIFVLVFVTREVEYGLIKSLNALCTILAYSIYNKHTEREIWFFFLSFSNTYVVLNKNSCDIGIPALEQRGIKGNLECGFHWE